MNNNIYKKKFLQKIILTSFLSSLCIIIHKTNHFNEAFKFMYLPLNNYIKFSPLIILSFYVPLRLSFVGSFLTETLIFIMNKQGSFSYNPLDSLFCAIFFGTLPGLILKKEDKNIKFFIYFIFIFYLYQIFHILAFLCYNVWYLEETQRKIIPLIQRYKAVFWWKILGTIIISFVMTLIIKKIIKNLNFLNKTID